MLEIGATKIVAVRKGGKVVLGSDNQPETKIMESVVQRITRHEYGHNSKYSRRLIVRLHGDDSITIRPTGLRTEALIVTANLGKLYKELLQRKLAVVAMAKGKEKAAKSKEARERRNREAKERRFRKSLRNG